MIGASRLSLLARVARLEASAAPGVSIGETIRAARARGREPPMHTKAELIDIAADEPSWSLRGQLARAQLRVRRYVLDDQPPA